MNLELFFEPIDENIVDYRRDTFRAAMGDVVRRYSLVDGFPDCSGCTLALIGVKEGRGSVYNPSCATAPDHIRHYLYRLALPNEDFQMVDLGNIAAGASKEDTYVALKDVVRELIARGITVIVLGGSDDLVLPIYQAYEELGRVINICSIDSRFNLDGGDKVNSNNYLQHIILRQPNFLFDYVSLCYQTYFVGHDMIRFMDELKFSTARLGEIQANIEKAEPMIRYSDVVAVDISAVRQSDAPANADPSPHGLYGEELCRLARYAGMSDKTSCFSLFEMNPECDFAGQTAHMLAHAVWFFIDGFYQRIGDFPAYDPQHYKRYTVEMTQHGMEIVFFKSLKTDRWWMEVPCVDSERRERYGRHTLVPCSYSDYQCTMENEIPELWWHYYNRLNVFDKPNDQT